MPIIPTIPELTVGPCARRAGVTVIPVFATTAAPRADYELASAAMPEGRLEVRELPGGATVARLQARNRGRRRVLVVDGDHLIGANQNRMVTSSALIGGQRSVELPVACVEQGRWRGDATRFTADATCSSPALRRIAKRSASHALRTSGQRTADQGAIWSQIASQQAALRVSSATSALAHTFAARADDIAGATEGLPYVPGAVGVALGIGAELVSIDLFDDPETCRHYWRRLIAGAALEGLGRRGAPTQVTGAAVLELLAAVRGADWSRVAPVGDGDELWAELASATGSLLMLDGQLVHLGIVGGAPRGRALDSRAGVMRHDLPDVLAARFRIVGRIGVGGAKEVFRAEAIAGGDDVAIARIPYVDPDVFADEVAAARRVDSAHVARILDACVDDHGDGYLVMERCDGPSLAELVARGPLAIGDAAPILVALARAVGAVHAACVLHRDVKLENAMLCSGDAGPTLKLLDFGLARRSASVSTSVGVLTEVAGTLPYMAREALIGHPLDARSDVFSLGVCCYRILVGALPVPPRPGETPFDLMNRLRHAVIDASGLPSAAPAEARAMIARMLAPARDDRPFMPEVIEVFERAFGAAPIAAPRRAPTAGRPALERVAALAIASAHPDRVVIAACPHAPVVVLAPGHGTATEVRAFGGDGRARWTTPVDGDLVCGVRADLDGDGARELYLAGAARVAALDAHGAVRFVQARALPDADPTLVAVLDPARPRLAVDGQTLDIRTGAVRGTLAPVYQGDGRQLVHARGRAGLSYNGLADQAFRGDHGTATAIINHAGERQFQVAQLEETRGGRVQLGVYGPGGVRLHGLPITEREIATANLWEISAAYGARGALLRPAHAPLAVLGAGGRALVIVPLLDGAADLPAVVVAFELPSGRELWRRPGAGGRALLADLAGDGAPRLVIGDGRALTCHDPWTGAVSAPIACAGVPIAFGDPFATGFAHLITASRDGLELWRGPRCAPGAMAWSGPRGDLWRTGTLRRDGAPLGPV